MMETGYAESQQSVWLMHDKGHPVREGQEQAF